MERLKDGEGSKGSYSFFFILSRTRCVAALDMKKTHAIYPYSDSKIDSKFSNTWQNDQMIVKEVFA